MHIIRYEPPVVHRLKLKVVFMRWSLIALTLISMIKRM